MVAPSRCRKHAIPQLFHLIHAGACFDHHRIQPLIRSQNIAARSQDHRRDLELPGDPQDLLYLLGILRERHHRHRPADLKRGMPAHGLALLEVDVRQLEKRNKFS